MILINFSFFTETITLSLTIQESFADISPQVQCTKSSWSGVISWLQSGQVYVVTNAFWWLFQCPHKVVRCISYCWFVDFFLHAFSGFEKSFWIKAVNLRITNATYLLFLWYVIKFNIKIFRCWRSVVIW